MLINVYMHLIYNVHVAINILSGTASTIHSVVVKLLGTENHICFVMNLANIKDTNKMKSITDIITMVD